MNHADEAAVLEQLASLRRENGELKAANERLQEEASGLREENARLKQETVKLRSVIRGKVQETMSSRLKDALRE